MPRKLRRLSGQDAIRILSLFGFIVVGQKGSHAKLRRVGPNGEKQTLVVPDHDELDRGTLRNIIRQASTYVPADQLDPYFYTD